MFHVTLEQLKTNNYIQASDGVIYAIKYYEYNEKQRYICNTKIELMECLRYPLSHNVAASPKYFKGTWLDEYLKDCKLYKEFPEMAAKT